MREAWGLWARLLTRKQQRKRASWRNDPAKLSMMHWLKVQSHCNHTVFTKLTNLIKINQNNTLFYLRFSSQCTRSFTPRVDPRVIFSSRLDCATSGPSKIWSCEHSFLLLIYVQQVAIMRPPTGLNAPPRKAIKKSQQSAVFCHLYGCDSSSNQMKNKICIKLMWYGAALLGSTFSLIYSE